MLKEMSHAFKTHTKSGAVNKRNSNISSAVRIPVALFLFSAIHFPGVWKESPYKLLITFSELNVIMLREELKQIDIQGCQFNRN